MANVHWETRDVELEAEFAKRFEHWRNQNSWSRDYLHRVPCEREKYVASKCVLAGVVIVGGLYFIAEWVVPFFRALLEARNW